MLSTVAAQSNPDFSGTWSLVTDQKAPTGRGRGGGGGAVSYVSGAPVNCRTECTIVQDAKALTISRPANQQGVKPPDVVLNLDGRESTITQSLNPRAEYTANAKWDGGKLVVTRSMGALIVTQNMSLEDGKLTVVSTFSIDDFAPVKLTYVKR
jgi:hypothetical protein